MYATAVVEGKVIRFKLSAALARAHRENRGKTMTEVEAIAFVEAKRRSRALRRAKPYLEPGEFLKLPEVTPLLKKLGGN